MDYNRALKSFFWERSRRKAILVFMIDVQY